MKVSLRSSESEKKDIPTPSGKDLTTPGAACKHPTTRVLDSRLSSYQHVRTYRRRECKECGFRFSTVEIESTHFKLIRDYELARYIQRGVRKGIEYARTHRLNLPPQ